MNDKYHPTSGTTPPSSNADDYGYSLAPVVERRSTDDALQWHVATASGNRFGPWPLVELKRRAETGVLTAADLVWRNGWPDWQTADTVPELAPLLKGNSAGQTPGEANPEGTFARPPVDMAPPLPAHGPAPTLGPPSLPGVPPALRSPSDSLPSGEEYPESSLAATFGNPDVLRVAARISGCLSIFWLLISVTAYFSNGFQWFNGVMLFFVLFMGLETAAVLMERQLAIGSRLEKIEKLMRRRENRQGEPSAV